MKENKLSVFFASLLILLGILVISGWIFHIPKMVQIIPGLVGMVFNTAFCFMLTGCLLIVSNYSLNTYFRPVQVLLSSIIFLFAFCVFSQDIFNYNLGIDHLFITPWLQDPNPTPGRMAPNTAIGFMLIATIGFLLPYGHKKPIAITIQLITFLILLIALLGLLVYSLKLEFILTWYRYTRMAVHTALGFLIVSLGWWATWIKSKWYKEFYQDKEDRKIILITGIILLCISMIASLGGIAWLTYMNISSVENTLLNSVQLKTNIIKTSILSIQKDVETNVETLFLADMQKKSSVFPNNFNNLTNYLNGKGFSGFQLVDTTGKILYSRGKMVENPALSIPLNTLKNMVLFWKNGYGLKINKTIQSTTYSGKIIFSGEIPLLLINEALNNYQGLGSSGEIKICSLEHPDAAICFPTRFRSEIFMMPLLRRADPLPMSLALSGHQGVIHSNDYRNHRVIAAYSMIHPFPLGIALEIDSAEIYKPISDQLKYILPVAILFICAGLILLHWQVVPLVKKVVSSEHDAKVARKNLELSLIQLNQKNKEITSLRELSALLQSCLTMQEACTLITQYGKKLLPDSIGILYFMYPGHHYLEYALHWGNITIQENVFQIDDCWALRKGRPHKIEEETDLICKHIKDLDTFFVPLTCIPLLAQGNIIGLFYIGQNKKIIGNKSDIASEQFLLASAFSEQIAIGISNIQLREKLHNQSIHDPLTGLYNRRYMEEVLEGELLHVDRKNSPLSLLMLDIDLFKKFNDTYGHDAGDAILIALSQLLKDHIRAHDFICRFGGEEFIFVMPGAPNETAWERATQLQNDISKLIIKHKEKELTGLTLSIGIATYPHDGKNSFELIKAADLALYHAKNTGRNKIVVYHSSLQKKE